MSEHVEIIDRDGVLEIHFARPDKKNALTGAMSVSYTHLTLPTKLEV